MNKQPVVYMQNDPRWKDKPYRTSAEKSTVGSAGCGPSCASMVIETLTGKTFTPEDACKWSMDHGFKATNQGTYYAYFVPQFKAYGIDCFQLNWQNLYHDRNNPIHKQMLEYLKSGYYVIALMRRGTWTSGGHFVLCWWADDKIHINDPASTAIARTCGNLNTFLNEAAHYWIIDARQYNLAKEEEEMKYYKTIDEIPKAYQGIIKKLIDVRVLRGYPDDRGLNLSDDAARTMVVIYRAGGFDRVLMSAGMAPAIDL